MENIIEKWNNFLIILFKLRGLFILFDFESSNFRESRQWLLVNLLPVCTLLTYPDFDRIQHIAFTRNMRTFVIHIPVYAIITVSIFLIQVQVCIVLSSAVEIELWLSKLYCIYHSAGYNVFILSLVMGNMSDNVVCDLLY